MQAKHKHFRGSLWLRWVLANALLLAVGLLLTRSAVAQDALPSFSQLSEGWNMLSPGGETTCALGDPYRFFVRPGTENNLLINFEGSSACWDEASCRGLTAYPYIYSVPDDDWRGYTGQEYPGAPDFRANEGVLQTDYADNPFQNYTIVMLPNCGFDSFLGNNVVTYGKGDTAFTVHFKGHVNATAALDWVYTNIEAPDSVFSISCAPGSLVHLPGIIANYDGVPFTQLGDSTARYHSGDGGAFVPWGTMDAIANTPALAGLDAQELDVLSAYIANAALAPNARFAEVNTVYNAGQTDILDNLPIALEELHAAIPSFRSYTGWGDGDCMLSTPDFYTHQVNGVRLRDWVAALAAGEDVEDVQCTDCESEELYEG